MGRGGDWLGPSLGEAVVDSRGFAARHNPAKTTAKPRLVGCPKGPCSTAKTPAQAPDMAQQMVRQFAANGAQALLKTEAPFARMGGAPRP